MARIMRRAALAAGGTLIGLATASKLWPDFTRSVEGTLGLAGPGPAQAAGTLGAGALSGVGAPPGTPLGDAPLQGIAALQPISPPAPLPAFGFTDTTGRTLTLADYPGVAGHGAVLNFWATWCPPCVAEMPSLATLSRALAPSAVPVLTVSADRGGAPVVQAFYQAHAIAGLPILLDQASTAVHALALVGLPTTLVIGPDGLERGRLEGSADWGTAAALARVRALLA